MATAEMYKCFFHDFWTEMMDGAIVVYSNTIPCFQGSHHHAQNGDKKKKKNNDELLNCQIYCKALELK